MDLSYDENVVIVFTNKPEYHKSIQAYLLFHFNRLLTTDIVFNAELNMCLKS
jgi:hypothetical protein